MTDTATAITTTPKAGWRTSEFWLAFAATLLSTLYASGVIGDSSTFGKALALVAAALTSAGYSVSRGSAKAV
jgi:hypothetical protein